MREIRFRVWDTTNKEMGNVYMLEPSSARAQFHNGRILNGDLGTDLILMQYTGLKDKNGREIYEGDAVKLGEYKIPSIVLFENTQFVFTANERWTQNVGMAFYAPHSQQTMEVLGNIYENPELLEAKP